MTLSPPPSESPKSTVSSVHLIPFDPESQEHIERLKLQRLACGWNVELVDKWITQQRKGAKSIHWIAIPSSEPSKESWISKHLAEYPTEAHPIIDTALSLRSQPIVPSHTEPFIPLGHISLDSDGADPPGHLSYAPLEDVYRITTFYVSRALHGSGIGRAAMDKLEKIAVEEPICAEVLALSTAADDYEGRVEKHVALGRKLPAYSIMQWYARRGYEPYKYVEKAWKEEDPTGKIWWTTAVFMKKDVK
ncbi:hypothetical protein B0J14DRAFT_153250 [Halenospora varia]|nr:hypothetical protein B0J14DRAFT_153250 [Halenospora varia]